MISITLSNKVKKQKRIAYDAFMLFGDVGGLRDFLGLFLSAFFGFFSERFMTASLVQTLFHASNSSKESVNLDHSPAQALSSISPIKLPRVFTLMHALTCAKCRCHGNKKRHKALELGESYLSRQLDVVKLVRQNRIFSTLLRLLLAKKERRLIRF